VSWANLFAHPLSELAGSLEFHLTVGLMQPNKLDGPLEVEVSQLVLDITLAVGGGLVSSLIIGGLHVARQWVLKRRCNISGDYISKFQDFPETDQWTESRVRLKQRGLKVWGTDVHADKREWKLEGLIAERGHISGTYASRHIYDDGVGSFYFKIHEDRLEGMWAGFANKTKTISSGRYILEKVKKVSKR
jgi:hypothetical protein